MVKPASSWPACVVTLFELLDQLDNGLSLGLGMVDRGLRQSGRQQQGEGKDQQRPGTQGRAGKVGHVMVCLRTRIG